MSIRILSPIILCSVTLSKNMYSSISVAVLSWMKKSDKKPFQRSWELLAFALKKCFYSSPTSKDMSIFILMTCIVWKELFRNMKTIKRTFLNRLFLIPTNKNQIHELNPSSIPSFWLISSSTSLTITFMPILFFTGRSSRKDISVSLTKK